MHQVSPIPANVTFLGAVGQNILR